MFVKINDTKNVEHFVNIEHIVEFVAGGKISNYEEIIPHILLTDDENISLSDDEAHKVKQKLLDNNMVGSLRQYLSTGISPQAKTIVEAVNDLKPMNGGIKDKPFSEKHGVPNDDGREATMLVDITKGRTGGARIIKDVPIPDPDNAPKTAEHEKLKMLAKSVLTCIDLEISRNNDNIFYSITSALVSVNESTRKELIEALQDYRESYDGCMDLMISISNKGFSSSNQFMQTCKQAIQNVSYLLKLKKYVVNSAENISNESDNI